MTFWGEEKGLLGSFHYVKNPIWPLEKTVANVNIEMIGRPEPGANEKVWMTGWERSDLGKLMNDGSQKMGVLTFAHPQLSGDMLYRASDNWPFAEKGVIAHSFSAGSLHPDYHKPSDHVEKLELKHMTRVIQGLFGGVMGLASGEATPKK
jgi:Zn-dependent M28 family amino/carboxypeptidase